MTEPIKISQEELDNLLILREKIRANVESIGRLNIKRHFIEVELKSAQEELAQAGLFDLSLVNERVEEVVERLIGLTNNS
jgi:guanylate kinase